MESERLVGQLEESYQELLAAVEGLGERQFEKKWLDNKWGAREITAHLTGWLGQIGGALDHLGRREPVDWEHWSEITRWNDTFAAHARGKQRHEIMHELRHAVDAAATAALSLPDEYFDEDGTARRWLIDRGVAHLREHASVILEWRTGEGTRQ